MDEMMEQNQSEVKADNLVKELEMMSGVDPEKEINSFEDLEAKLGVSGQVFADLIEMNGNKTDYGDEIDFDIESEQGDVYMTYSKEKKLVTINLSSKGLNTVINLPVGNEEGGMEHEDKFVVPGVQTYDNEDNEIKLMTGIQADSKVEVMRRYAEGIKLASELVLKNTSRFSVN